MSTIAVDNIQNVNSGTNYNFIKQVVSFKDTNTNGDQRPSGNATYTDTDLVQSITPTSSSSKILIMTSGLAYARANAEIRLRILRDSTAVFTATSYHDDPSYWAVINTSFTHLDSPNTTDQITYKMQMYSQNNSGSFRFNYDGSSSLGEATITLLEIAG